MRSKIIPYLFVLSILGFSLIPFYPVHGSAGPAQEIDPAELEHFLDGAILARMNTLNISGAVVAVVQNGELIFSKGYGYADRENAVSADPARTLFRPGSVSKLFVWTAVMQLVEQGKLSLDEDINTYLDFEIPPTFPEPITMAHLMTHTPGFEDVGDGLYKLEADQVAPLDKYLKTHLPHRVFPPGQLGAYSNYGTALAGYIVERIAGVPFYEYVEDHIFAPLGMSHSTFREPVPQALLPDLSRGYNYMNDRHYLGGFEFLQPYPAGGLSATTEDMARFMIAHLQDGQYLGNQILKPETARQMHEISFRHDPRMRSGVAHGFFASVDNGQFILSHGGDTILFHTGLYLLKEHNLGVYISTNTTSGAGFPDEIFSLFLDRYFPAVSETGIAPSPDFASRMAPYLGEYSLARRNFTTFEKIITPLLSPVNVDLNPEGYLILSILGESNQFVEVEPGLLQDRFEPGSQLAVVEGENGQRYILPPGPFAFIKTPWYGTMKFHGWLFGGGLLLYAISLVTWLVRGLMKRGQPAARSPGERLARLWASLFGLGFLGLVTALGLIFMDIHPGFGVPRIFFGQPPAMAVVFFLPVALAGVGMLMLAFTLQAWRKPYWTVAGRIHYSLLTLAAGGLLWGLHYWNLLF